MTQQPPRKTSSSEHKLMAECPQCDGAGSPSCDLCGGMGQVSLSVAIGHHWSKRDEVKDDS